MAQIILYNTSKDQLNSEIKNNNIKNKLNDINTNFILDKKHYKLLQNKIISF